MIRQKKKLYNDLASNMWQPITWTDDGPFNWLTLPYPSTIVPMIAVARCNKFNHSRFLLLPSSPLVLPTTTGPLLLKCIFLNENVHISIKISLKFVPKGTINNIPALVQIMASRRPGDKPLWELVLVIHRRIYASLGLNQLIRVLVGLGCGWVSDVLVVYTHMVQIYFSGITKVATDQAWSSATTTFVWLALMAN